MKETTTIEPFGEPDNPDLAYFKGALRAFERLQDNMEKFAENPGSAHGIAHLAEAVDEYGSIFDVFGQDESPFSYHWMSHLTHMFGPVKGHYHQILNNKSTSPGYNLGRNVERVRNGIEQTIEDIEQCIEYAEE